jgi:uncharacterized protein YodC (DUF2158 family)
MIETLILIFGRIKSIFTSTLSRYKVGDVVILKDGSGYPLLVIEVRKLKNKSILLYCRWYDRETKETRHNFYPEDAVKPFNWQVENK